VNPVVVGYGKVEGHEPSQQKYIGRLTGQTHTEISDSDGFALLDAFTVIRDRTLEGLFAVHNSWK
jgi:hypothetical protein